MSPGSNMDATYQAVAQGLPEPLREYGETLPFRLGLTQWPQGQWQDFWVLDINRDLPGYVAEDRSRPHTLLVPPTALASYRAAHHCSAIYGLIADRLVDRQVTPDSRLFALRWIFRQAWERSLAQATGDPLVARREIARALASLRRGTQLEVRAMAKCQLDVETYALQTREKLRWGSVAAACLLRSAAQPERATLLVHSYDLFCFALQCLDDALDCEEDERTRGTSVPAILGVPPGGMVRATVPLVASAILLAQKANLEQLAGWLRSFEKLVHGLTPPGDPAEIDSAGSWLAAAAEKVLRP